MEAWVDAAVKVAVELDPENEIANLTVLALGICVGV